jgi:hypothetical protein
MRVRVRSTVRTCTPHASMHSAGKENVPKEDDDKSTTVAGARPRLAGSAEVRISGPRQ